MSVLSLAQAKNHLNVDANDNTHDVELQRTIDAAEAAIANRVGPLSPTAVTVRSSGFRTSIMLPITPVLSITSITPAGATALDLDTVSLDVEHGLLANVGGGSFGARTYDIVYVAGRTAVPEDLLHAIRAMLKHLWRAQRGASTRRGSGTPSGDEPSLTYAVPNAVAELIGPHEQIAFA